MPKSTKPRYGINATQSGVVYQLNRVGASPLGSLNPMTGKPSVRKTWATRHAAGVYATWMRARQWDDVQVVEV